jgi:hypothetical protein
MPKPAVTDTSPADEYEQRLADERGAAARRVRRLAGWWAAAQVVALTELCTALILRDRFDADAAVTTGLIWAVSIPVAAGALAATLRHWAVLPRSAVLTGLAPWGVTLVETSVVAAVGWLLA